jgi:hypothetical protein
VPTRFLCLYAFLPFLLIAQTSGKLPVKRIVLYKNGLGYFEHQGPVTGQQDVAISFTSSQLNDVLKSLTVLDLNGGRIAGVSYGSVAPASRQLGDLPLQLSDKATLTEFLGALRGARLEVRSGTNVITGRLLSVERKTRINGGTTLEVDYLSLISDNGDVRTTELSPAFSVRLLEKGLSGKVDKYLNLAATAREPDIRKMVISAEGTGERNLFVSYISEVPVWKATYRIVLGAKSPLLQGWAIIDNTVGQDWDKVELSLVAGAPQSFVQNLSQPYYSRRPVVALPQSAQSTPQTFEATLRQGGAMLSGSILDASGSGIGGATVKAYDAAGSLVAEVATNAAGHYEFQTLPDGPARLEAEAAGFNASTYNGLQISSTKPVQQDLRLNVGSVAETVNVREFTPPLQTSTSTNRLVTLGRGTELPMNAKKAPYVPSSGGGVLSGSYTVDDARARAQAAALAQELGDLFEYKLKDPISIAKNSSALVPIVQANIAAEKVSIWNEQTGLPKPQRALWLTNTSGLTLDGGTFSITESGAFAGEGLFDPIRPNEKRLISYATDLALNASTRNATNQQRVTRVRIEKGLMTQESEVRETKTYAFRNEDATPRTVIVEHPVRNGYELRGAARPVESTNAWQRFRLEVPSKETAVLVVEEARPLQSTYALTNLTGSQIVLFVSQKSIDKDIETALRAILAQKDVVAALEAKKDALDTENQKIFDDQERLRENMKALKGSPEEKSLLQRYTRQLNEQEDRLEALSKEIKQLESQQSAAQEQLDRDVLALSFDVKL